MRTSPLRLASGLACRTVFLAAAWAAAGCASKPGAQPSGGGGAGGGRGGDAAVDVAPNPLCFMSADDVISDFARDNGVKQVDGRAGGWYTYGDRSGRGTLMPMEGAGVVPDMTTGNPTCSGMGSLHVTAVGFVDWGAAMGVDIMPKVAVDGGELVKGIYDASRYRGVAFWAKAAAPVKFVQVKFTDPWTDLPSVLPVEERCVYNVSMPDKNCSPYIVKFGYGNEDSDAGVIEAYPSYASARIDTEWKRFEILFADTKQDAFNPGQKSPGDKLDTTKIMGMAIQVNSDHATTPPTANDFNIWVDDVVFLR